MKKRSDENNEKHQLGDYWLIQNQFFQTQMIRIVRSEFMNFLMFKWKGCAMFFNCSLNLFPSVTGAAEVFDLSLYLWDWPLTRRACWAACDELSYIFQWLLILIVFMVLFSLAHFFAEMQFLQEAGCLYWLLWGRMSWNFPL